MSAASAPATLPDGGSLSVPSAEVTVSDDGERVTLKWWPSPNVTARALFRVATDDEVIQLVDLGAWRVAQRGETGSLGWSTSLDRIPEALLGVLERAGYTAAELGETA